jgi:hypothetical protein
MAKQLLVELDEPVARGLERVAPARSRWRSAFSRAGDVKRALGCALDWPELEYRDNHHDA